MAAPLNPNCTSLQTHHPVIDMAKLNAGKLDHVDLDAVGVRLSSSDSSISPVCGAENMRRKAG